MTRALLLALLVAGVTPTPTYPGDTSPPAAGIVFPAPPERARLRWVRDITDNADSLQRTSWWRRVARVVAGAPRPVPIVRPWGVKAGRDLLLVCDPGAGVVHGFLSAARTYVRYPREGSLPSPIDAAVDREGRVHVTDSALGEVRCYDAKGNLCFRHEAPFTRPTGIAYHEGTDRLYIVDTVAHCVRIRTPDGASAGEFGRRGEGPGELNFPVGISVGGDGNLWVTDSMNFRVQAFTPTGEPVATFGQAGDGPGDLSKPKGVAVDGHGRVWIVDAMSDSVRIFEPDGTLLLSFGREGRGAGEFWLPSGIDVEDPFVYVADSYNHRVQVFELLPGGEG